MPTRWLHQTLYMLGSAPGVTAAEADQMIRCVQAAARLWEPMRVTYGPAVISAQSVTLRVSPVEPAAQLHGAVLTAAAAVIGDRAPPPPNVPYWGHMTLAYANSAIDDGPLLSWLAAHPVEPVTVTVRAIHLVRQSYRDRLFRWAPVAAVPLGRSQ